MQEQADEAVLGHEGGIGREAVEVETTTQNSPAIPPSNIPQMLTAPASAPGVATNGNLVPPVHTRASGSACLMHV